MGRGNPQWKHGLKWKISDFGELKNQNIPEQTLKRKPVNVKIKKKPESDQYFINNIKYLKSEMSDWTWTELKICDIWI